MNLGPEAGNGEATKEQVRLFWSRNPMFYGSGEVDQLDDEEFRSVCRRLDRVFYQKTSGIFDAVGAPMYTKVINYEEYRNKRVLEIGFGAGSLLKELYEQGLSVHGIDLSDTHVAFCTRRIELGDFKAAIQQGDAEQLPYKDQSFDLVVSHGVLHHTPDIRRCFDEIHRVLKPGGRMVTMLYHRYSFRVLYIDYFGLMRHRWKHPNKRVFCSLDQAVRWASDIHDPEQIGAPVAYALTKPEVTQLCSRFSEVRHMTWDYPDLIDYFPLGIFAPACARRWIMGRVGYFLVTTARR